VPRRSGPPGPHPCRSPRKSRLPANSPPGIAQQTAGPTARLPTFLGQGRFFAAARPRRCPPESRIRRLALLPYRKHRARAFCSVAPGADRNTPIERPTASPAAVTTEMPHSCDPDPGFDIGPSQSPAEGPTWAQPPPIAAAHPRLACRPARDLDDAGRVRRRGFTRFPQPRRCLPLRLPLWGVQVTWRAQRHKIAPEQAAPPAPVGDLVKPGRCGLSLPRSRRPHRRRPRPPAILMMWVASEAFCLAGSGS
jgi:hypothetical protein